MKLENDKTLVRSTRTAYADALLQLGRNWSTSWS